MSYIYDKKELAEELKMINIKFKESQAQLKFMNDFNIGLMACFKKWQLRNKLYNDNWKTCNIQYLRMRLEEEIREYHISKKSHELVDIANFCLMILTRENNIEGEY